MKSGHKKVVAFCALVTALSVGALGQSMAAPCLTNSADPVGNPVFGATVGTFVGLGITPGNGTGGTTCIENGLWTTPTGFGLGSYIKGADGSGIGVNNTVLGSYSQPFPTGIADAANHLDHGWVQDTSANANPLGTVGGPPSTGIVWDLGGQANQVAVFVFVDHGPVPGEVLENTAWLSNDPNAADAGWTQASLVHVYGAGWEADPTISDGFVAVYQLAGGPHSDTCPSPGVGQARWCATATMRSMRSAD